MEPALSRRWPTTAPITSTSFAGWSRIRTRAATRIWSKPLSIRTRPRPHGSRLTSCDVHVSVVCARAWFGGYRLSRDFYTGDRAMRESGFDSSNRFGPFSGDTQHFAPVCLNSLLYRYERDLEHLALLLGNVKDAAHWDRRSQARSAAIQRYLWRPKDGVFADFDFVHARSSSYAYITSLYPLVGRIRDPRTGHQNGIEAEPVRASRAGYR